MGVVISRGRRSAKEREWLLSGERSDRSQVDAFLDSPLLSEPPAPWRWVVETLVEVSAAVRAGRAPVTAVASRTGSISRSARTAQRALVGRLQLGLPFHEAMRDPTAGFNAAATAIVTSFAHAGHLADGLDVAASAIRSEWRDASRARLARFRRPAFGLLFAASAGAVAWLVMPLLPKGGQTLAWLALWSILPIAAAAVRRGLLAIPTLGAWSSNLVGLGRRRRIRPAAAATQRLLAQCLSVQVDAGIGVAAALHTAAPVATGTALQVAVGAALAQVASGVDAGTALESQPELEELATALRVGRDNGDVSGSLSTFAASHNDHTNVSRLAWLAVPTLSSAPWALLVAALLSAR